MPLASVKIAPAETEARFATKKNAERVEPWTKKNIRGQGAVRFWQLAGFAAAFAASPLCVTVVAKILTPSQTCSSVNEAGTLPSTDGTYAGKP